MRKKSKYTSIRIWKEKINEEVKGEWDHDKMF